jgi:steroid delta-isomerase-like uncharacterized protein
MTVEAVRRLIDGYVAAEVAADIEKCMTFFAEDAVWEDVGVEQSFSGKDAIREAWEEFFAAIADYEFERTTSVADENGYAFSWTMRCKVVKPFGDFQANGQRIELKGSSVGQVREGKIVWNCDYWNLASVARQIQAQEGATGSSQPHVMAE